MPTDRSNVHTAYKASLLTLAILWSLEALDLFARDVPVSPAGAVAIWVGTIMVFIASAILAVFANPLMSSFWRSAISFVVGLFGSWLLFAVSGLVGYMVQTYPPAKTDLSVVAILYAVYLFISLGMLGLLHLSLAGLFALLRYGIAGVSRRFTHRF